MKTRRAWLLILLAVLFLVSCVGRSGSTGRTNAAPPSQPGSGPGGADAVAAEVATDHFGVGDRECWVFEPSDPAPAEAPVVVFLHGWGGMNPQGYGAWIAHLVRKGNVVIYPRYQKNLRTKPHEMTPAAIGAIREALDLLMQPGHVKPRTDCMVYVGHSLGGVIAANAAALAGREGLPAPRAVMSVEPGDSSLARRNSGGCIKAEGILGDLRTMPADTLLMCIVGADDRVARTDAAVRLFRAATSIPEAKKVFITVSSDDHGAPPLRADHFFPVAPDRNLQAPLNAARARGMRGRVRRFLQRRMAERMNRGGRIGTDALDYYGTWRLLDALAACAESGTACDASIVDGPTLRFMGRWSDGAPVRELTVTRDPGGR